MPWIDEMLLSTKKNVFAAAAKRHVKHARPVESEDSHRQPSAAKHAWKELLTVMRKDVNEFNIKGRAGLSPALMTSETTAIVNFQFEVYLPQMNSKLLVLTLDGNSLHTLIRPEFPDQQASITLESAPNNEHYRWMLGETDGTKTEISVPELSERLLRTVLSSAETG